MTSKSVTKTTSYSIIGTGALGGYYGARLHHGGATVRFLLHSDYDHVRTHGFKVESPQGDFSISQPEVYAHVSDLPPSDVVVVALKTTQNRLLGELLPPATAAKATVLMMQNGLGIEADADAVVPGRTVLGGLAFLCSNKVGPGHIKHLDYGDIRLGQYRSDGRAGGVTPAMERVAEDFRAADIGVDLEADLDIARWKKLVWNVPYNGLCVARNCTTDVIMNDPTSRQVCKDIMIEVLSIAEAYGHHIDPRFVEQMLRYTDKMARYKPSMKLDFERRLPLELEAIYVRPLEAARAKDVACPNIAALYEELVELDPA
jgi:2-dehydropantoate 2-reductase